MDAGQALPSPEHVYMGVVEAGNDAAAVEVDDSGMRPGELLDFRIGAGCENTLSSDGEGFHFRLLRIFSPDLAMQRDEIDLRLQGQE